MNNITETYLKNILLWLLIGLTSIEVILVICDLLLSHGWPITGFKIAYKPLRLMFNLTREDSIATWFASMQAMLVSGVIFMIFLLDKQKSSLHARRITWALLALLFFYISFDDGTRFHENMSMFLYRTASPDVKGFMFDWFPSYPWILMLFPLFGGMGIMMLYAIINYIDDHAAKWFIFTGLSLYVIAVMLDFVEGTSHPGSMSINFFDRFFHQHAHSRHTIKVVEEFIEMFGTTCILIGFVRHFFVEFTIKRCMAQNRNINRHVTP